MKRERGGAGVDELRADLQAGARSVARPRRIFTVTGTSTALAIEATMWHASPGSSRSVAPAPVFVTLRTGQPKLMSTMSAPAATTIRADSAISAGLGAEELNGERVLVGGDAQVAEGALVPVLRPAQLTISEQTSPAPKRRPWRRNACTLTPAIGASTSLVGISTSPISRFRGDLPA